jgi:hypothetical protein
MDGFSSAHDPRGQPIEFGLIEDRGFYGGNEFGQRTDVNANGMATESQRFYKRRPSANMIVKHQVARPREYLNSCTGE